jgi:transposase
MGRPAGWMNKLTGRGAMRSPGAPSHRRETERRFWEQIATGITSEKAAEAVGVSQAVGTRWFRHNGGMPLSMLSPISGRYLSFAEREEIGLLSYHGVGVREIARRIGRNPSTVSRELTRNAATRGARLEYRASVAQWKAELVAKRPKPSKLVTNPRLHHYVQTVWRAMFATLTAVLFPDLGKRRSRAETSRTAVIVNGLMVGHQNRFPSGCRPTFRMTNLCASLTKPFTRLSISRVEGLSNASWLAVCTLGVRYAYRGLGRKPRLGRTLART